MSGGRFIKRGQENRGILNQGHAATEFLPRAGGELSSKRGSEKGKKEELDELTINTSGELISIAVNQENEGSSMGAVCYLSRCRMERGIATK